jgi:hypothetical protein
VTVFASTTVEALDVEMKALAERILADARTCCPECKGLHLAPFVDINPARIPPREATQLRIACPTPAVAEHTAALLRGLGAPAHAIHLGGTTS